MSAPSAPRIRADQFGGLIRVMWRAVDDATDYNIYVDSAPNPTGIEDSVADDEVEDNGWFIWWSGVQLGQVFVRVKALNALAEESAYSNEVYRYITSEGDGQTTDPSPALEFRQRI